MTIKVLDHGFVRLIETWGGGDYGNNSDDKESGIIEAARQSTQGSFRGWDQDARLLKFLYDNKHSTPFEFAGMIIEVCAPIFVFREWHRHRTQCLAGDTLIPYFSPRGTSASRTIKELFDLKNGVEDSLPKRHKNGFSKAGNPVTRVARRKNIWRTRVLPHCQTRILRVVDEITGQVSLNSTKDIYQSGKKEIFSLRLNSGLHLRASAKHPILTSEGWVNLADLRTGMLVATLGKVAVNARPIPPSLRSGIGVWTSMMRSRLIKPIDTCYICKKKFHFAELQLDHIVPVRERLDLALSESNLAPTCIDCHRAKTDTEQFGRQDMTASGRRWQPVLKRPERVAEEMTYDIEMDGPHHNFVANGIFVHNSYNEMSARYAPLPDVNYRPDVDRCLIVNEQNKQAGSVKGAEELTHTSVLCWLGQLDAFYARAEALYQEGLKRGMPKEVARVCLPVGRYSQMRASANLRNWMAFLTLRMSPDAQWEIRQYANAVGEIISHKFPRTWELFKEK